MFSVFLARGISKLADATKAVGEGAVTLPRFRVRELALVGEGLKRAAAKIAEDKRSFEVRIADATSELRHQEEEKRRAEAALAHAQKLESLGQLTSGIAHDFNNLLAVILGSVEGIERRAPNEHLLRLARQAKQGAERGARLVKALLAFARKQPLRPEIANPNLLIKEFEPMLRDAAGDTVQLQLLLSPTLHPCRIDAAQFQSALLNLVINSGAAMPRGGRITIETRNVDLIPDHPPDPKLGGCVRISVSDTGEGMSPEVASRAFEPFFTTKEPGKGSGAGHRDNRRALSSSLGRDGGAARACRNISECGECTHRGDGHGRGRQRRGSSSAGRDGSEPGVQCERGERRAEGARPDQVR